MTTRTILRLAALVLPWATQMIAQEAALKVYGPGGPQGPMQECAEMLGQERGVKVEIIAGPEKKWIEQAKMQADVFFGGAEYMLTQFMEKNPDLENNASRTELYPRAAGILVRPGNPKNIRTLADLARDGVRLVDVTGAGQLGLWEDLAGRHGLIAGIQRNIAVSVPTSAEAIEKWKAQPELDAWITYESWHYRLKETTELVRLPAADKLYRGTPIALARQSKQPKLAAEFIAYLKSDVGHGVFRKWGWK